MCMQYVVRAALFGGGGGETEADAFTIKMLMLHFLFAFDTTLHGSDRTCRIHLHVELVHFHVLIYVPPGEHLHSDMFSPEEFIIVLKSIRADTLVHGGTYNAVSFKACFPQCILTPLCCFHIRYTSSPDYFISRPITTLLSAGQVVRQTSHTFSVLAAAVPWQAGRCLSVYINQTNYVSAIN